MFEKAVRRKPLCSRADAMGFGIDCGLEAVEEKTSCVETHNSKFIEIGMEPVWLATALILYYSKKK